MKKLTYFLTAVLLISSIIAVGGCASKQGISKNETIYTAMNDKNRKVFLTEDNTEVVKVKNITMDYTRAAVNRDYRTIKGDEEYGYYSKDELNRLKAKNDQTETVKLYKDAQLVQTYGSTTITGMYFTENYTKCAVSAQVKSTVDNITTDTSKALGLNKGSLIQNFTATMIKENDTWKVDAFQWVKK